MTTTPPIDPPWAFALNQSASRAEVEVTLLTLVVVGELVRVSGLIRIGRRVDVVLAGVPALFMTTADGLPLAQASAHLLPLGPGNAWVSWVLQRPATVAVEYVARIERLELVHPRGRWPAEAVAGPWAFAFTLTAPGAQIDDGVADGAAQRPAA